MLANIVCKRNFIQQERKVLKFVCYLCKAAVIYKDRYQHCVGCFKRQKIKFLINENEVFEHFKEVARHKGATYELQETTPQQPAPGGQHARDSLRQPRRRTSQRAGQPRQRSGDELSVDRVLQARRRNSDCAG